MASSYGRFRKKPFNMIHVSLRVMLIHVYPHDRPISKNSAVPRQWRRWFRREGVSAASSIYYGLRPSLSLLNEISLRIYPAKGDSEYEYEDKQCAEAETRQLHTPHCSRWAEA
jgi:hypothetical protein